MITNINVCDFYNEPIYGLGSTNLDRFSRKRCFQLQTCSKTLHVRLVTTVASVDSVDLITVRHIKSICNYFLYTPLCLKMTGLPRWRSSVASKFGIDSVTPRTSWTRNRCWLQTIQTYGKVCVRIYSYMFMTTFRVCGWLASNLWWLCHAVVCVMYHTILFGSMLQLLYVIAYHAVVCHNASRTLCVRLYYLVVCYVTFVLYISHCILCITPCHVVLHNVVPCCTMSYDHTWLAIGCPPPRRRLPSATCRLSSSVRG